MQNNKMYEKYKEKEKHTSSKRFYFIFRLAE